jgi:hypothetical protein
MVTLGRVTLPPPDQGSLPHNCSNELSGIMFATWKGIVCEGHIRADEDIFFDMQAIPELRTRLHYNEIVNGHAPSTNTYSQIFNYNPFESPRASERTPIRASSPRLQLRHRQKLFHEFLRLHGWS